MAAKVEQNYKEHATSIDRWGRYTSVEVLMLDESDVNGVMRTTMLWEQGDFSSTKT